MLRRAAKDPDPLVAETAAAGLYAAGQGNSPAPSAKRYLTIEKVLMLKEVSIFQPIPHEILADVAAMLIEHWAEAGERLITKGEPGDCLYVIASGRVRVHDGERILGYLEEYQFFGELSLLDTEPRSASFSAVERSHLFCLTQSDFYSLIGQRPEISQAINRVLCQMVRKANAA